MNAFEPVDSPKEGKSQGLKPAFPVNLNVRAKARTYLRSKNNGTKDSSDRT